MARFTSSALLVLALTQGFACIPSVHYSRSSTSLSIVKNAQPRLTKRQGSQSGAVGLGDARDSTYSILITVGNNTVPVLFDTGSSDLWSITSDCTTATCGNTYRDAPQISPSSLEASGVDVHINFGDSAHMTSVSGFIGSGPVSIAGLHLNDLFIAAINQTNTSLSDQGLSGIFGTGFPSPRSGSAVFADLIRSTLPPPPPMGPRPITPELTDAFISALPSQGPFISRLVANSQLKQPMFTVTLERETIEVGGNIGQLTIGELPYGVSDDSLTWVPVRLYSKDQGGLAGSSSNPNEVYPVRWEIPVDDVLLNNQKLPTPSLPANISYTALIDSGTSFLAGPEDVVSSIYSSLQAPGTASPKIAPNISCSAPVNLTFIIGGKAFPVDPRDFLSQQDDARQCNAGFLLPTDPPDTGALMSWILGDPFMKSTFVAFYFGNLTHPSVDPPRMGFLSTVPGDANQHLDEDVKSAQSKGDFVATSVAPPNSTFTATSTNSVGVAQAPTESAFQKEEATYNGGAVVRARCVIVAGVVAALGALAL